MSAGRAKMRRSVGWAAACLGLAIGVPAPAQAQIYGGSFYPGGGSVQVITPDYTLLRAENQFFAPTYRGVRDLCGSLPHLCSQPQAQAALAGLRGQHQRALTVELVGGGALVAGLGATIWGLVAAGKAPAGSGLNPQFYVGLGAMVGGGITTAVGSALMPQRDDVRQVINAINRTHKDDPVQWSLSCQPHGRGLLATLSRSF